MRILLLLSVVLFASAQNANYNRVLFWHDQLLQAVKATSPGSIFWLGEYQHAALSMAMHESLKGIGCKRTSRCDAATANLTIDVVGQYVLKHYYPHRWLTYESFLLNQFLAQPDEGIKRTAKRVGVREAEKAVIELDTSGIMELEEYEFALGVEGRYQPCPPNFSPPSMQHFAYSKPLVLPNPGFFIAPPIPPFNSAEYEDSVAEVRLYGDVNSTVRSVYQTRLARYMDGGNFGGNPESSIGTFTRVAEQLIVQTHKNLFDSAAIMRILTTVSFDRNLNHMYNKRVIFDSWRPITPIRGGIPSNPNIVADPNWTPMLFYNSNQEYPAGHPTASAASIAVLRRAFGGDNFTFTLESGHADYPYFTFTSLSHLQEDTFGARIWAGLHFRFSIRGAQVVATQVADYIYDQLCPDNTCFSRP